MTISSEIINIHEIERSIHDFIWEKLPQVVSPTPIEDNTEYRIAREFKETFEPKGEIDYEWILGYSKDIYDRSLEIYKELDDKANDIIKYLGGGTGIFTLAVLANIKIDNVFLVACVIPSFLCALLSIFFACLARKPNPVKTLPSIRSAIEYAESDETKKRSDFYFLGQWHLVCEGVDLAVKLKSKRVTWATWLFFWSIALLLVPLIFAICQILVF